MATAISIDRAEDLGGPRAEPAYRGGARGSQGGRPLGPQETQGGWPLVTPGAKPQCVVRLPGPPTPEQEGFCVSVLKACESEG